MFRAERKKAEVAPSRKRANDLNVPFEEHVRSMRAKIQDRRGAIPDLHAKATQLQHRADAMVGTRHLQRLEADTRRRVARIQEKIAHLESPEREVEFDHMVAPYQRAYRHASSASGGHAASSAGSSPSFLGPSSSSSSSFL